MKFCSNCGTQLEDSMKFCSTCGTKQPEIQPQVQTPVYEQVQPQTVNTAYAAPQQSVVASGTSTGKFKAFIKKLKLRT